MLASLRRTTFPGRARSGKSGGRTHHDPQAFKSLVQALQEEGGTFLQTPGPQMESDSRMPFKRRKPSERRKPFEHKKPFDRKSHLSLESHLTA